MAQKIKQVAQEAGVAVENRPLARALYAAEWGVSAAELYKAVAEVLTYVYRLKEHRRYADRCGGRSSQRRVSEMADKGRLPPVRAASCSDVMVAAAIITIVLMMIIPLPTCSWIYCCASMSRWPSSLLWSRSTIQRKRIFRCFLPFAAHYALAGVECFFHG